jgi:hypothetical protein
MRQALRLMALGIASVPDDEKARMEQQAVAGMVRAAKGWAETPVCDGGCVMTGDPVIQPFLSDRRENPLQKENSP